MTHYEAFDVIMRPFTPTHIVNIKESDNIVTIHSYNFVTIVIILSQYGVLSLDHMVTIQSAHVYGELWLNIYVNRFVKHIVSKIKYIVTIWSKSLTICFPMRLTYVVNHNPA